MTLESYRKSVTMATMKPGVVKQFSPRTTGLPRLHVRGLRFDLQKQSTLTGDGDTHKGSELVMHSSPWLEAAYLKRRVMLAPRPAIVGQSVEPICTTSI